MRQIGKIILVCFLASPALAANWFVLPGGAGAFTGLDWNNAWDCGGANGIAWSSVAAGDTIWFAGGSYSQTVNPAKSGTAGSLIAVKRATVGDSAATSAAGWSTAFDSQVIILKAGNVPWLYNATTVGSYMTIDGRTDSGFSFRIDNTGVGDFFGPVTFSKFAAGSQTTITFTNCDLAGPEGSTPISHNSYECALAIVPGTGTSRSISTLTFGNCRFHGCCNIVWSSGASHLIFDHCKFYDNNGQAGTQHQNLCWMDNGGDWTYRYCQFWNWAVEGIYLNGNTDFAYVYGCWFHQGAYGLPRCIVSSSGGATTIQMKAYNNTFVDFTALSCFRNESGTTWSSDSQTRNNLFYNSGIGPLPSDSDYNFSSSFDTAGGANSINNGANPFVNYAGGDYHIVGNIASTYPRNKGVALTSTYNTDPDGTSRTGLWSIGAMEFNAGGGGGGGGVTNFFASPTGSGANTGLSTSSPWTLVYALTNAGPSNNVYLMDGNYPDMGGYDVVAAGQNIRALNKWKPVLTNSTYHGIYSTADYVTIDGLEVTNAAVDGIKMAGNTNTVRNCWVTHSGRQNISCHNPNLAVLIENNLAEFSGIDTNTTGDLSHGIYVGAPNSIIRNNVSRRNTGYGIQVYPGGLVTNVSCYNNLVYSNATYQGLDGGIVVYTTDAGTNYIGTNYFYGNTVIQYGAANGCFRAVWGTTQVTNNILVGDTPISTSTDTCLNGYNLSTVSISPAGTANVVNASPGFLNAPNGLYWLNSGSAARGIALAGVYGAVNFFSQAQTSVIDASAFQYSTLQASDTRTLDPSTSAPNGLPDYWAILTPIVTRVLNATQMTAQTMHFGGTP